MAFFKKKPKIENPETEPGDIDAVMKKYDRESNTRPWEGIPAIVIKVLLAAFSVFMIYMNLFAVWDERIRRPLFLGIVILFVFILYPARK